MTIFITFYNQLSNLTEQMTNLALLVKGMAVNTSDSYRKTPAKPSERYPVHAGQQGMCWHCGDPAHEDNCPKPASPSKSKPRGSPLLILDT